MVCLSRQRQDITRLAAILRLANAFDASRDHRIQRLQVMNGNDGNRNKVLLIAAQGYSPRDNQAEAIAAARHLLETVYRRPVMIKPMKAPTRSQGRSSGNQKPETGNQRAARSQKPEARSAEATQSLPSSAPAAYRYTMTHAQLVEKAVRVAARLSLWRGPLRAGLRQRRNARRHRMEARLPFRPGRVQDFPRRLPGRPRQAFPAKAGAGTGLRTFLSHPAGDCFSSRNCPPGWGLLELRKRKVEVVRRSARDLRTPSGLAYEMNLLLASLRRVEIRIEPQTITEFLKWKNRMQQYNGGACPTGMEPTQEEPNYFLEPVLWNPTPSHVGTAALSVRSSEARQRCCQHARSPKSSPRSDARPSDAQKQNRAGWPGFEWRRVEMRLHHHAARTGNKTFSGQFDQKSHCALVPGENKRRREEHALASARAMPIKT